MVLPIRREILTLDLIGDSQGFSVIPVLRIVLLVVDVITLAFGSGRSLGVSNTSLDLLDGLQLI